MAALYLNSLTHAEIVTIKASFYYLTNAAFQCDKKAQDNSEKQRISFEDARKKVAELNHCFTELPKEIVLDKVYKIRRCFCRFFDPSVMWLFKAWAAFDKAGVLPFPGSYTDQPAKIFEVFSVFDGLKAEQMEEERKKMEAKNKAKKSPRRR